jgi:hypothetical protein
MTSMASVLKPGVQFLPCKSVAGFTGKGAAIQGIHHSHAGKQGPVAEQGRVAIGRRKIIEDDDKFGG